MEFNLFYCLQEHSNLSMIILFLIKIKEKKTTRGEEELRERFLYQIKHNRRRMMMIYV